MSRGLSSVPRTAWLLLLLGLLGLGGYFAFHALFVKVGRSVEQPYSGPAKHNPFYVLQRYLEERGLSVRMVRAWPQPLASDTLVLWFSDDAVPLSLRSWLSQGGQLWSFSDPDDTATPHAWSETPWQGEEPEVPEEYDEDDAIDEGETETQSEAASADENEAPAAEEEASPDAPVTDASDAGASDVSEASDEALLEDDGWCDDGCLAAAQFAYGSGCLTLVRRYGLTNERVSLGETPARIDALLKCRARPSSVLIVTSVGSPWFGQLLLEHAPSALFAFAVLLTLVLWRNGVHFGPRPVPPKRERRQLLEHVGAVGMLAGRVGLLPLLAAARNQLRKQLLRRVPQAANLAPDALVQAVAEATDLPPGDVQRALLDQPGTSSQEIREIARAVQALWRKT